MTQSGQPDDRTAGTPEEAAQAAASGPAGSGRPAAPVEDASRADTAAPESDAGDAGAAQEEAEAARIEQDLVERTADLQRLQAEFLNYKRRVERDRELIRENATFTALAPIIEVLDTIDRAREHGPLDGGFKAVAEQLERAVEKVGLTRFGAPGDAFDPMLHEALSHIGEDPDVQVTTAKVVAKAGYKIGDRVVRAAQVLVVDPASGGAAPQQDGEQAGVPTERSDPDRA